MATKYMSALIAIQKTNTFVALLIMKSLKTMEEVLLLAFVNA